MYINSTATDAHDLYADLLTALQSNAALTGAVPSQAWVNVWQHTSGAEAGIVLRGPGLSATDQVYVGLKLLLSTPGDSYELYVYGMTGVIPSALELTNHVNVSPGESCFLDVGSMNYWFVANGRRFVVVAKMSTVFQAIYAGLFLPYGDPTQYPYPMILGGTTNPQNTTSARMTTWRDSNEAHRMFISSRRLSSSYQQYPSLVMLTPMGEWKYVSGYPEDSSPVALAPRNYGEDPSLFIYDDVLQSSGDLIGYNWMREQFGPCFDGSYTLTPFTMIQWDATSQVFGVLDGVYNAPGQNLGSEDIIQISAVDHLAVNDVYRTGTGDYWALKLE